MPGFEEFDQGKAQYERSVRMAMGEPNQAEEDSLASAAMEGYKADKMEQSILREAAYMGKFDPPQPEKNKMQRIPYSVVEAVHDLAYGNLGQMAYGYQKVDREAVRDEVKNKNAKLISGENMQAIGEIAGRYQGGMERFNYLSGKTSSERNVDEQLPAGMVHDDETRLAALEEAREGGARKAMATNIHNFDADRMWAGQGKDENDKGIRYVQTTSVDF